MKKGFIYMFMLMAYTMGSIGGFGYAIYSKAYVIAVAILLLAWMAFPKAKEFFEKWIK
jgi:hypothetical protein